MARAWNGMGHMVVAQMAYIHLNPLAKAQCNALIAVTLSQGNSGNSNFITAACWADDHRTALGTANWHYIDIPFSYDLITQTNGFVPESFDVVQALNLCITTLRNTNATPEDRATSLRYILHCVGDIHQPLHCVTAIWAARPNGDAGGNAFSINGDWSNLHSLWDAGGGANSNSIARPLTPSGQTTLSNKVTALETLYPFVPNPGTIPNPMTWAQEGLTVAQNVSYAGITPSTTPSSGYLSNAQFTANARLALGGHRLADLLNTIFPMPPIQLSAINATNGNIRFLWSAVSNATYQVRWKAQLTNLTWNVLTNITATSNSVSFSESRTQPQRFYQVTQ